MVQLDRRAFHTFIRRLTPPYEERKSQLLFDDKIQKLCSILASMATAKFNQMVARLLPEKASMLPLFDARVWQVPTLDLVFQNLLFREF